MLDRSIGIIGALVLFVVVCGCVPPGHTEQSKRTSIDAAKKWAADMRLTPLSIVCDEYRVPGVDHRRVQCDVRTLEIGVVPLTCGGVCRLGSV